MKKIMYVCLICVTLLMAGCTESQETEMSEVIPTPSAVSVASEKEQYSVDPAVMRKQKYEKANMLIGEKDYKEAYTILKSLNAYRDEFPDLYDLNKKVRILTLETQKVWSDDERESQIVITGKKVRVKIHYTSESWKERVANYTGKIDNKRSTPYKIAVVHKGKVDYIRTAFSYDDQIFDGSIYYEVYNARECVQLFTKVGLEANKKKKEEYEEYLKAKENNGTQTKKSDPSIGMTASEVEASSWGEPERKNITEYAWGTKEQWVYSSQRYVYLENGIVTSIQRSE